MARWLRGHIAHVATLVVAVLSALLPWPASAQRTHLRFERIAQEHGLSNGTVTAIAQDSTGFLWLGTEDGLDRYDGAGFTSYRPVAGDPASIGSSWITGLAVAPDGRLWVSTVRGGISSFDPRSGAFSVYRHIQEDPTSLSSNVASTVHVSRDGMVWVGTPNGLDMLDPATGRVSHHVPHFSDSPEAAMDIKAIVEDGSGLLWVGTLDRLLVFDRKTGRFEPPGVETYRSAVHAIVRDSRGVIWVGSEHELAGIDPVARRVMLRYDVDTPSAPSPFSGRVLALYPAPDGALWVGSDGGLARLDPIGATFTRHRADRSDPYALGGDIVRSIFMDRGGVLWAGLESYGLGKFAPSVVRFDLIRGDPTSPQGLSSGYVRGISEDRDGNLWIGTQFGGLNHMDRGTGVTTSYRHREGDPRSLPGDNVWAALEDRSGVLWVATHRGGFGTFDPRTGTFHRHPALPPHASVSILYEDRRGALLVGTEGLGMLEISPDRSRITRYGAASGNDQLLASNDIQAILEDSEGALWVGGIDGLTRLDREAGESRSFRARPGEPGQLQSDFVTSIFEDRAGTIWVATKGGGLSRLDRGTGRFSTLGTAQGLPHSFVYGILEDARGKLWLSTDNGIASLEPGSGRIVSYGLKDGLQAREFNRRAFHRAADGTMYFGGINGINVVRPDDASPSPPSPPVSIVSLRAASGPARLLPGHPADSVVRLRYDESSLAIAFRALDFSAPDKISYRYRLVGLDRDWIESGNRGEATYGRIPPGRYTFQVSAAGQDGEWNPTGASLALVIMPPWWGTWWARLAAIALIVSVALGLMRLRVAAVRRRSRWLEQRVEAQTQELTRAQVQLRRALERERDSARELLDITAAVPGAVFQMRLTDSGDMRFSFVSAGVLRLLHDIAPERWRTSDGDVAERGDIARQLFELASEEDRALLSRSLERSRVTMLPWRAEWRWPASERRPDGWLQVQAQPGREPDGSIVWTGVLADATAARKAEAARAALEAKVLQAQQAESLAVLAGGIAHDFNNLLVGVQGNAELLEADLPSGSEASDTVGHIRAAAARASDLTRQLLAYAGRGRFVVERVDVAALVREMLALVRTAVPRTIAFDFQQDEGPAAWVEADATQLRQVVMNLVTNASEAIGGESGRVCVRVRTELGTRTSLGLLHAAADMPEEGPYVVLEVSDDGVGMEQSTLARIFDPFYTTKFTGRGLGLAALLGVVRAHHGGLNVVTSPGEGARFLVYLPRSAADEASPDIASPGMDQGGTRAGAGGRVLVVDDEPDVSQITGRMLGRLGHQVTVVPDGASALEALDSAAVDVILMDVTMPRMDGPSTARALRKRGVDARIVLMSGYAESELIGRGVLADADAFLQKPFTQDELAAAVQGTDGDRWRLL